MFFIYIHSIYQVKNFSTSLDILQIHFHNFFIICRFRLWGILPLIAQVWIITSVLLKSASTIKAYGLSIGFATYKLLQVVTMALRHKCVIASTIVWEWLNVDTNCWVPYEPHISGFLESHCRPNIGIKSVNIVIPLEGNLTITARYPIENALTELTVEHRIDYTKMTSQRSIGNERTSWPKTDHVHGMDQSWGQFRSGIGFACQFQFRNWNWNWIGFSQSDQNWNCQYLNWNWIGIAIIGIGIGVGIAFYGIGFGIAFHGIEIRYEVPHILIYSRHTVWVLFIK